MCAKTYEGRFTEEMEYEFDNSTTVSYEIPRFKYDNPWRVENEYKGKTYIVYVSTHKEKLSDGRKVIVTAHCRIGKDKDGNWIRESYVDSIFIE